MGIQDQILLALSRTPGSIDYPTASAMPTIENALQLLEEDVPDFNMLVSRKRIADLGCGLGLQSLALVQKYHCRVVGIDTNPEVLIRAVDLARSLEIDDSRLTFVDRSPSQSKFDLVLSYNSFEHFSNPELVLSEMSELIDDSGKILISFGPPWFAPYGSHMNFFCRAPWINILFSEKAVMNVRSLFRNDGARRYADVESGLNKMTLARFERIVASLDLKLLWTKYRCVKGINLFSHIPLLKELLVNHISVILCKSAPNDRSIY